MKVTDLFEAEDCTFLSRRARQEYDEKFAPLYAQFLSTRYFGFKDGAEVLEFIHAYYNDQIEYEYAKKRTAGLINDPNFSKLVKEMQRVYADLYLQFGDCLEFDTPLPDQLDTISMFIRDIHTSKPEGHYVGS